MRGDAGGEAVREEVERVKGIASSSTAVSKISGLRDVGSHL